MHKITTAALALGVGGALALGVPLAATAAPASTASAVSASAAAPAALSPTPTKPAYPPTKPPRPPHGHHKRPYFHGGFWWFPFSFGAGTFHPGSIVHIVFTGFGGFHFVGTFQADESGSVTLGTAAADGSLTAQVKATGGSDLAGQTLNATVTDSAGTTVAESISVPAGAATGGGSAPAAAVAADPATLAQSGTYISLATVWGAVGLLVLGAAFVTMRAVIRRKGQAKV